MSVQLIAVLAMFLVDPDAELYGAEITEHIGLLPGTVYPILARLLAAEWLAVRDEEGDPVLIGRPLRRYYRLTHGGIKAARAALNQAQIRLSLPKRGSQK